MSNSIIQVKNLCKTYNNDGVETQAICGVNFEIPKGQFVAIVGPSGSGKSTLMQILGLLDKATGGEYLLEDQDTQKLTEDELAKIRNKKIGFVFQSFNLLPRTTVAENVELPLLYSHEKIKAKDNKQKVISALSSVMMEHRDQHLSNQLSGGEKQRVAIARALVNDPEIILADEPTGNLDSKSGLQIMKIFQKLNDEGKTIILITHETYTAQHAERIISVKDGQIIADSLVEDRRIAHDGEMLK
jgi:putative ABC transport system ATP-binding protein